MDYHFNQRTLNVIDEYKGLSVEEVKGILATKRSNLVMAFEHISKDFNLATSIRNSNAFGCQEIIVIGSKQYDRRGTVGCHHYETLSFYKDHSVLNEFREQGYTIIAAENLMEYNPISITEYIWPDKCLILFGEEGSGITPEGLAHTDQMVYIGQVGSVRSLNLGTASGIFAFHYAMQKGLI
jgi:tRNA G18 (ribose-2'-O)-methylase SpoU